MQLEIGMSTNRYFPAIGTAGFERLSVSGASLDPWPPPKMMANVFLFMVVELKIGMLKYMLLLLFPKNGRSAFRFF